MSLNRDSFEFLFDIHFLSEASVEIHLGVERKNIQVRKNTSRGGLFLTFQLQGHASYAGGSWRQSCRDLGWGGVGGGELNLVKSEVVLLSNAFILKGLENR